MSQDNWKNRSEGMRCKSCIWFVPKEDKAGTINLGRCRKHAPTMGGFPVMFVNDWCGEHRLDENSYLRKAHGKMIMSRQLTEEEKEEDIKIGLTTDE